MEPFDHANSEPPEASGEAVRTGSSVAALKRAFRDNLFYVQARFPEVASLNDRYLALAYTVRDRLLERWVRTARHYQQTGARTVCLLSAEYLPGPQLGLNLLNLGLWPPVEQAMAELGLDLATLLEVEREPGLGNGGLGRLAACYLDSLATLKIPSIAYGIRYEFGIFRQEIRHGGQVELADHWLAKGNPWEIARPEIAFTVGFGGHTEQTTGDDGRLRVVWHPDRQVKGVAYDTPILGFGVENANLLRLWKAEAPESFDFAAFNRGDYYAAVEASVQAANLTEVLYPNDEPASGRELRLAQQLLFCSCALRDMIRIHLQSAPSVATLHEKYVCQLNDTHPSIAVAELMRILVDDHDLPWEEAWAITRRTFAYTNHTLLPEALERWPLALFGRLLPRHLEILFEINRRFLDEVRRHSPGDEARVRRLSLIDEEGERAVRMAHLACVGSFAVNGVSALHTKLLRRTVLRDFAELWPERFVSITNGVSPRRFLLLANPPLARLITERLGDGWASDLDRLHGLEQVAADPPFQDRWRAAKGAAKGRLAAAIRARTGVRVDPASLFDVQVKRIHEYKRPHLNLLHILTLYLRLKEGVGEEIAPRTFVFGGKAAPGYRMAKLIVRLIVAVARLLARDPASRERLRVVFYPDFNVKEGARIYPAADLSEQISTAGYEASGTGNMKMAMNGALTIGTLDGANVEIREQVGEANFFAFGLTAAEVAQRRREGHRPRALYDGDESLRAAVDLIRSDALSGFDRDGFRSLGDGLLESDPFLVLADYPAYLEAQAQVARAWTDPAAWTRMSILNVARIGRFSSDRAVAEYNEKVWHVEPVAIPAAAEAAGDKRPHRWSG